MWRGYTWAYGLFKRHHTELNGLLWSFVPVAADARRRVALAAPEATVPEIFDYKADALHVRPEASHWKTMFPNFENWVRLSALLAICGYIEVYLQRVVALALASDPGVRFGKPRAVDGFIFKKQQPNYDFFDEAKGCVEGDWNQRIARYRAFFGKVPQAVEQSIGELQKMTNLRNSIAHTFGRELRQYAQDAIIMPGSMERLTQQRLEKFLALADLVASEVDKHLGTDHIGEYETLSFYQRKKDEPLLIGDRKYSDRPDRVLGRLLIREHGHGPGTQFCQGLIQYYQTI